MITLPKNTERKIVALKHGRETWAVNPDISCPYCHNRKIWTRLLCCNTGSDNSLSVYDNSPHFCAQCSSKFILYRSWMSSPEQETEDNRIRAACLDKDSQLTIGSILHKTGIELSGKSLRESGYPEDDPFKVNPPS